MGYRDGRAGINPIVYDWIDDQPQRKSIKTAKALLAEAGYPNGIDRKTGAPLILYFDVTARSSEDRSKLDWMRKQFQKLNIQLVVRSTDYNRFQDKIRKGNAQIFEWGWNADYPDPENFLFLLYGPQRKVGISGENAVNYDNDEYNQLFEKMKNMEDGAERQLIIDRMVEILRYDAPWLWGIILKTMVYIILGIRMLSLIEYRIIISNISKLMLICEKLNARNGISLCFGLLH